MLAHPADLRPTLVVVAGFAAVVAPFLVPLSAPALALAVAIAWLGRAQVVPHAHNHAHVKVFRGPLANAAFDLVLAVMSGFTTPGWELQHVHGHHRHYLQPERDPAANGRFSGPGPLQRPLFALLGSSLTLYDAWTIATELARTGRRDPRPRLVAHQLAHWTLLLGFLLVDPLLALTLVLLPQLVVRSSIFWFSYRQHDGVPATEAMDASVTHLGALNGLLLNVGHHTAHHDRPGLHWSQLPTRTAELRHRIPDVCIKGQPMPSTA